MDLSRPCDRFSFFRDASRLRTSGYVRGRSRFLLGWQVGDKGGLLVMLSFGVACSMAAFIRLSWLRMLKSERARMS